MLDDRLIDRYLRQNTLSCLLNSILFRPVEFFKLSVPSGVLSGITFGQAAPSFTDEHPNKNPSGYDNDPAKDPEIATTVSQKSD